MHGNSVRARGERRNACPCRDERVRKLLRCNDSPFWPMAEMPPCTAVRQLIGVLPPKQQPRAKGRAEGPRGHHLAGYARVSVEAAAWQARAAGQRSVERGAPGRRANRDPQKPLHDFATAASSFHARLISAPVHASRCHSDFDSLDRSFGRRLDLLFARQSAHGANQLSDLAPLGNRLGAIAPVPEVVLVTLRRPPPRCADHRTVGLRATTGRRCSRQISPMTSWRLKRR
jgi:hypothetical protein